MGKQAKMHTTHLLHSRLLNIPTTKALGVRCNVHLRSFTTMPSISVLKPSHKAAVQFPWRICRGGIKAVDSDDYFHSDPDAFDVDDYDECVLGAEALRERRASNDLANACLDGLEGSCRVAFDESGRAGKKMAKSASQRLAFTGFVFTSLKKTVRKVVGDKNVESFKQSVNDLPEGWLARIFWFWEQPFMKIGRLTMFFARLPAVWALAFTQFGLFAGQLTLPMLPPLLLGGGMLMRTIWVNANFIFPRIYLIVILLWITWFANSLVQKTILYFRRQGTLDSGFATTLITCTECTAILIAAVIILSMSGVNVSGLFLPAGICFALAAKDLSHNFLAGIFLFLVQPFRMGDQVSVQSTAPGSDGMNWFQGRCEKVDLRYTTLRKGSYRLFIPNKSFITKEFVVMDQPGREMLGAEDGHLWDNMPGTSIDDRSWPDASNGNPSPEEMQVPTEHRMHAPGDASLDSPPNSYDPDFLHVHSSWTPYERPSTNGHFDQPYPQGQREFPQPHRHPERAPPAYSQYRNGEKHQSNSGRGNIGGQTDGAYPRSGRVGGDVEDSGFRDDRGLLNAESHFSEGDVLSYNHSGTGKQHDRSNDGESNRPQHGERSPRGDRLISYSKQHGVQEGAVKNGAEQWGNGKRSQTDIRVDQGDDVRDG